ncbi:MULTISPECIES: FtsX-like permease family protein [Actinomadura]|uniref:FtsX-like permease family protein n=1 Tax=Actinomadura litoris TaxID=2678616 RepID=A0A7K1KVA4_9ACTN|nr:MULTISPECIES: ABC transporter permease [Actinomadura]MBT2211172.1 ABC transporter permease [Actinomadura sp. NEAU-AAG7]MUN36090.1 FtsX-like permease family protein [Actinomadura litoris]
MIGLAFRSLRKRAGAFVASFLSMFLGATILMAFASMLDTANGDNVTGTAKSTLTTMASVVGGWGLLLVVFAVTSTLTLSVRQRAAEMALLKSIGATPAQLGRMIVGEAAGLAVVAALLAIAPAVLAGRALLGLLHDTHQVPGEVSYSFGPIAVAMGLGITFVSATLAALLTARRATRVRVTESLMAASTGTAKPSRKRLVFAGLFLLLALDEAIVTCTLMRDKGSDAMATSGQADILAAIGLALLSPLIMRRVTGLLAGPLRMLGATGDLAVTNMRRRTGAMAAAVTPIILFTATAVGTLFLQATENAATRAAGVAKTADQKGIETLNLVVIGMVVLFTAIMLVNTLVAATAHRRREFGQTRLAGATPRQVLGTVALESVILTVTGVACGTVAAVFTIVPFGIARKDSPTPDGSVWTYLAVVALAAVLTGATAYGATRRALRTPAVNAVMP